MKKNIIVTQQVKLQEKLLHSWEVSDEYGWRSVELIQNEKGELSLFAYDQDGGEVPPNVSNAW